MTDLLGKTIGQYQLIELIHQDDNTVYKGFQPATNRYVAVKILAPLLARNLEFAQQFRRDMQFVAGLEHANILSLIDYGRQDDLLYMVTPYIEGGSLEDRLSEFQSPEQAQQIIAPLAEALEFIHSRNTIHGNLKPSNILMGQQDQPLLTDIGYTQGIDVGLEDRAYLSPELIYGEPVDSRTDIYALGVLLYHMMIGEPPPPGAAPSPRLMRPDLPIEVEKVILKAMAENRELRFQTASEFSNALEMALTGEAEPVAEGQSDQRFIWLVGGLAVVVVALLACIFFFVLPDLFSGGGGDSGPTAPEPTPTIGELASPVIDYPAEGTVGEPVTFDGSQSRPGSSPIASYDWDFGDGNTDSGSVVTHVYDNPGTYQVTLTVTGQDGFGNTAQPVQITIREADETAQAPVAAINGPREAQVKQILTFSAGNSRAAAGSRIVKYEWDFDDGSTATGVEANHAYDNPGTYEVELTITDDMDLSDSTVLQVRVEEEPPTPEPEQPPVAVIEAPSETRVGQTVTFNATASQCANQCRSYVWDLGDGTTANAVSIQHVYQSAGDYNVVLTVTDDQDLQSSTNRQIAVIPSPPDLPNPIISIEPSQAEVNQEVTFDGSRSQPGGGGNITTYEWDFGDGNSADGAIVTHSYDDPGTYQVTLTVTDADNYTNISSPAEVVVLKTEEPEPTPTIPTLPEPVMSFPTTARAGEEISFDGSDSRPGSNPITSYEWDFGDGNTDSGDIVTHIYDNTGTYQVTLMVTDENGFGNTAGPVEIQVTE